MNIITGWFSYKGTTIQQHLQVGDKLRSLFNNSSPAQVLEIGTASGGLTILIRDLLNELNLLDIPLRSYDINPDHRRYELLNRIQEGENIEFILKNIFNDTYDSLIKTEEITQFIQRPGKTIVMCDGGSKQDEFRILSPLLKPGDIIMAHDYSPDSSYFEKYINGKVWNWHEIKDEDIQNVVTTYNLQPYMQEEMQKILWVCKIKI